ncbi:MAG: GDP-mannose 4,6-dehydratase [Sphaerospermopsis kisseleviana]
MGVFIIDNLLKIGSQENKNWLESQADKHQLTIGTFDISNADAVNGFFEKYAPFDGIAHLAGQVAMTTSMKNPRLDFLTNAVGTFNLLEANRQYSPNSVFIYASTNKVYGEMKQINFKETETRYIADDFPNGFDENLPLDFSSPYGCSKGAADQYVRDWSRNYGLNTIVFRHSSIYGGRQFATFDQGWIGWFCMQALKQKQALEKSVEIHPFTIAGNGKQVRDILHIEDVINLYELTFTNSSMCRGEVFNIGGGIDNSLSLLELFKILSENLNMHLNFQQTPWRHSDQKLFVCNLGKISKYIGWHPKINPLNGIRQYLSWLN